MFLLNVYVDVIYSYLLVKIPYYIGYSYNWLVNVANYRYGYNTGIALIM